MRGTGSVRACLAMAAVAAMCVSGPAARAQAEVAGAAVWALPDAPQPQTPASGSIPKPNPCPPGKSTGGGEPAGDPPDAAGVHSALVPCQAKPLNWYERFVNGPKDKPLTARDKGWMAARNVLDPFNLITIGGEAGISVGADSHSPYGPGMPGYARYVGVSFTQDMTDEFFGTFLIPVIVHQDPHYHRMQGAKIPRRMAHVLAQAVWTQGDNGRMMPNYANLVGFAIDDGISNLYVPGRDTDAAASAERYGIAFATVPIGNFVNEFLPDVASHIHVQVVIIQRIINQVARSETAGSTSE